MADDLSTIDDFTDPGAGGLDDGAGAEEIVESPAAEAVGTILTQSLTDMPELDGLKIGDTLTLVVEDITDDNSYQLAVQDAIPAPVEELAAGVEAPGRAGIIDSLGV